MTKEKLKELRFVILAVILGSILVFSCIVADFNVIDFFYLLFLVSCIIRYVYIAKKN